MLLHSHHASEDANVWPKLHERCPDELQTLVGTMEAQHEQIDGDLRALVDGSRQWAATGAPAAIGAYEGYAQMLNIPKKG